MDVLTLYNKWRQQKALFIYTIQIFLVSFTKVPIAIIINS